MHSSRLNRCPLNILLHHFHRFDGDRFRIAHVFDAAGCCEQPATSKANHEADELPHTRSHHVECHRENGSKFWGIIPQDRCRPQAFTHPDDRNRSLDGHFVSTGIETAGNRPTSRERLHLNRRNRMGRFAAFGIVRKTRWYGYLDQGWHDAPHDLFRFAAQLPWLCGNRQSRVQLRCG